MDARATCRRGWPVVVTCAGWAYRLDRATLRALGAAEAVERLGLERVPGVAPVLVGEGTDRARWVVRLVRSALPRLRELAATPRPPLRSGGPPLPPVATLDDSAAVARESVRAARPGRSDSLARTYWPGGDGDCLPAADVLDAVAREVLADQGDDAGASSARPAPSGHVAGDDGDGDDSGAWGQ